jgi:hypothetical protein
MAYEKRISRANPGLIIMVLDDSISMGENLPGTPDPKYKWVESYCGIIWDELLARSTDTRGQAPIIKPRYYILVIKYGSNPQLWGSPEMDIETAVKQFANAGNSMGLGGLLGATDAKAAFNQAYDHLQQILAGERFRNSFPPMVFHLTDGESQTDAKPEAEKIMQLSTNDGKVLVVNAYIGTQTNLNYRGPEDFPGYLDVSEAGSSRDNIRLFEMSSEAPEAVQANLKADGIFPQIRPRSRLFFDVRTKEMLKHTIQVVSSIGSRVAG